MPPLKLPWKRATRPRRNHTIRSGQSCRYQHYQAFRLVSLTFPNSTKSILFFRKYLAPPPTWAVQPYQGKTNLIKSRIARVPDYLAPQIPSILHLLRVHDYQSCLPHLPVIVISQRLVSSLASTVPFCVTRTSKPCSHLALNLRATTTALESSSILRQPSGQATTSKKSITEQFF